MTEFSREPLTGPGGKPEWAMSRRELERAILARHGLRPRRRWPWVLLVLLIVAAAAGAWEWRRTHSTTEAPAAQAQGRGQGQGGGAPQGQGQAQAAAAPMLLDPSEWTHIQPATLRRTIRVTGPLAPIRQADLAAQVAGEVESVDVEPGDAVTAGETLAQVGVDRLTLDLSQAKANLGATQAQIDVAQGQLDRARALVERGVSAESTLADPEGSLASLQATLASQTDQVTAAQLALDQATVTAPFDGRVATRAVDPGAVVASGTPLLTLVDLSAVEMQAAAPVSAGARLKVGQTVEVAVDGIPDTVFPGTVDRVAPVAEEGTRTLTAYVRIENPDGVLLGGMFATGEIVTDEAKDALAVPSEAVLEDDQGSYVLVLENDAVARRAVTLGGTWGDQTQIASGLAPGDAVVMVALKNLAAGQAVDTSGGG